LQPSLGFDVSTLGLMLRFFIILILLLCFPSSLIFCDSLDSAIDDLAQPNAKSFSEEIKTQERDLVQEQEAKREYRDSQSTTSQLLRDTPTTDFGEWAKEALKKNIEKDFIPVTVSNPVQPESVEKTVPVRADLGFMGNRIRNRLRSEIEKDYFDQYWLGRGKKVLGDEEFLRIVDASGAVVLTEPYEIEILGQTVLAQKLNYYKDPDYRYALGVATLFLDAKTRKPIGFFDNYNFDSRPWGARSLRAEVATRSVELAGSFSGAKDYEVCYGVGCEI
jgi:hypothetical protein